MAFTTVSISPTLNNILVQIQVSDTTDYAGQGIPLDGSYTVSGYLRIYLTSATGTTLIYDNIGGASPDINPVNNLQNTSTIALPQDSNGNIMQGTYTFTYYVEATDGSVRYDATNTYTYDYDMALPEVCLTESINCVSSMATGYDETDYGTYASTISRTHTLYPPPASPMSSVTSSTATVIAGPNIYDKTWTHYISSDVTYVFSDGLTAILQLQGSREFEVLCDIGLSKLFCCLDKMWRRYKSWSKTNPVRAQDYWNETVAPTNTAVLAYKAALDAGSVNKATQYYQEIIETSGCGDDCGCSDDSPQQVYPVGATAGQFNVDSPDGSITVIPEVVGSVTTFHVQVSSALQQIISNFYTTTVTTTTPSYLQIVQTGTTPTRNYEINFIPTAITGASNLAVKVFVIDPALSATPDYIGFTQTDVVNQGTKINNVGSQTVLLGNTVPNQSTDVAIFYIDGIFVTSSDEASVTASLIRCNDTATLTNTRNLDVEVFHRDYSTGRIILRLYNPQNGQPYTLADLMSGTFDKIYIGLNITA